MRRMNPPTSQSQSQSPSAVELHFNWSVRVYYEDTDAGGIVFYANYLKFFERARTEWLRACGINQHKLASKGDAQFVVSRAALDYRAPARLDDMLTIVSQIARIGRASIDFIQEAWRDGALLTTGTIRVGCVGRSALRPTAIPPPVLEALRRGPPSHRTAESSA
ncbi:tol-pal system-associated acyl-CoA thioesterase [Paraburkholderia bonniea]|uniref:tol-pal system-associated acyl-CoA thioesterase n=1 Tax=Paraburkholderia bonniea TaxID=2152891 RepID=UPI0012923D80|nr:tol-pal system-associated acyl-CoA thioesterase [Paraburkholderia bonniea]WJF90840.1 tol-pal system-associated acyl-CoA thioesterase [Paraburkholderia bonniea]WJF94154.1 tol-pal system-associated acyl-CoA thioesterase [Paraburkholderia bonniea]